MVALLAACVLLPLLAPCVSGIKCQRTETGYQPHARDCGPYAKGCRVIVKPYKLQNNSAVATCRPDEKMGDFAFDCAVDCPAKDKLDWNEVLCCKTENCNGDLKSITGVNYCYVSKGKPKPSEMDNIEVCSNSQKCARNTETGDTSCVPDADCKGGKWMCCTDTKNCGKMWGIYKVTEPGTQEESTDAANLVASARLLAVAVLVLAAVFDPRV